MKVKSEFLLVKKVRGIKVDKNINKHKKVNKSSNFISSQNEALMFKNIKNNNSLDFGVGGYGIELI